MRANRRLLAAGALVAALSMAPALPAAPAPEAAATAAFSVRGSVEQLSLTHAVPGATVALLAPGGAEVDTGTVDAQGGLLFRDVAPGDGYVAVHDDGGVLTESDPVTVRPADWVPTQSFYDSQVLPEGFGYLATRDGTTLSVNVFLPGPADAGPYPTVVEYSGYDPSNPSSPQPSTLIAQNLGYATVGVNMRGTGCSGGSFMYFEELQSLDGYDVIEAVAAQPWVAHGEVGMIGVSYPGISQLFVARTRPPHLAAIAPLSVIADTYRSTLYPGGIFNDGFALDWARGRVASGRPYGQGWERGVVDAGGPNGEQCAENQLLRLQNPDLEQLIADNPYYEAEAGDALSPVTFAGRDRRAGLHGGSVAGRADGWALPRHVGQVLAVGRHSPHGHQRDARGVAALTDQPLVRVPRVLRGPPDTGDARAVPLPRAGRDRERDRCTGGRARGRPLHLVPVVRRGTRRLPG